MAPEVMTPEKQRPRLTYVFANKRWSKSSEIIWDLINCKPYWVHRRFLFLVISDHSTVDRYRRVVGESVAGRTVEGANCVGKRRGVFLCH